MVKWAFGAFDTVKFFDAGAQVARPTSGSAPSRKVALVAPRDLQMLVPREDRAGMQARVVYRAPIEAPIAKGQKLGALEVERAGPRPGRLRPRRRRDVPRGGLITRINAAARLTRDRAVSATCPATEAHGRGALHQLRGHRRIGQVDAGPPPRRGPARPRRRGRRDPRARRRARRRADPPAPGRGRPRPLVARDRDPALHRRAPRPSRAHHPPGARPRRHGDLRPLRRLRPASTRAPPAPGCAAPSTRCTRSSSASSPTSR